MVPVVPAQVLDREHWLDLDKLGTANPTRHARRLSTTVLNHLEIKPDREAFCDYLLNSDLVDKGGQGTYSDFFNNGVRKTRIGPSLSLPEGQNQNIESLIKN